MVDKKEQFPDSSRKQRGKTDGNAMFPVATNKSVMPVDYPDVLKELKLNIANTRLKTILAANSEMVLLYWGIGKRILDKQQDSGWGAKVIDRLSFDLNKAFPDMSGFSTRNLKYMRAFASAWPDQHVVQEVLAQLPWYHNITLLEKLNNENERLWYAKTVNCQRQKSKSLGEQMMAPHRAKQVDASRRDRVHQGDAERRHDDPRH